MPFVLEFSRNWKCKAPKRPVSTSCSAIVCQNGDCEIHDVAGRFPYGTCKCDKFWIGHDCSQCCDMPCVESNGGCRIDFATNLPFCDCYKDLKTTGVFCEKTKRLTKQITTNVSRSSRNQSLNIEWEIPVIVTSVVMIVFAVLFCLLYIARSSTSRSKIRKVIARYRSKVRKSGKVKKEVHLWYARDCSDTDAIFVQQHLKPFLTKHHFTVNTRHASTDTTDATAVPSVHKPNATAHALEQTMRRKGSIMLLISADYLHGEWPQISARSDLLQQLSLYEHITIIMLPPLHSDDATIPDALRHILNTHTCLHWPQQTHNVINAPVQWNNNMPTSTTDRASISNESPPSYEYACDASDTQSDSCDDFWTRLLLELNTRNEATADHHDSAVFCESAVDAEVCANIQVVYPQTRDTPATVQDEETPT